MRNSEIKSFLFDLSPRDFEVFIAELWEDRGWKTEVTAASRDDGVDVVIERNVYYPQKRLIQVKHKQEGGRIHRRTVQQYAYLHQKDGVDEVIIVTTGTFTQGAVQSAITANIKLIGIDTLVEILRDAATERFLKDHGYGSQSADYDPEIIMLGSEAKSSRRSVHDLVSELEADYPQGSVPIEVLREEAKKEGWDNIDEEIERLKQRGELYEPEIDRVRTT